MLSLQCMEMSGTLTDSQGQEINVVYREEVPEQNLDGVRLKDVHAFCFYNDKLVLVYKPEKDSWSPPGGGIEPGESHQESVVREIKEETNMEVFSQELIGYMDVFEPTGTIRQTRSYCRVKPYGPFESDPDGDVTKIKLIDPENYRDYFEWQEIGDHIVQRAINMHNNDVHNL